MGRESAWMDEDGLIMQEPMFQIREWYARYGIVGDCVEILPELTKAAQA